jgi:hypothetical protein
MAKIRPLSPDLQKKAEEELHEVPSRIESDLAYIREWLSKQPHIRANPDDQVFLIIYLRIYTQVIHKNDVKNIQNIT